ncbi:TPR repeat [Metschnikowia aff. pulcherrima]|uniref:TPR repeat n=1 Tax=Metschnikowia aff. pulcherrima TaxID=2163413 RepID=A0A4P6XJI6_9ASCO|nr:TPR repeat [Metschnikowia aff. pulcherrima]
MGLIARLRHHDSDRRRLLQTPSPSHTKASASVLLSASDFLHTSLSLASSQDLVNLPKARLGAKIPSYPPSHRNSMPVMTQATGDARKRDGHMTHRVNVHPDVGPNSAAGHSMSHPINHPVNHQMGHQMSHLGADKAPRPPQQVLQLPPLPTQHPMPPQNMPHPYAQSAGQLGHVTHTGGNSGHAYLPPPQPESEPLPAVSSGDDTQISVSEDSADDGSEFTSDGESEGGLAQAKNHPYYEQWKQYYKALEQQRQQGQAPQGSQQAAPPQMPPLTPLPMKKLYPGMNFLHPSTASDRFYNTVQTAGSRNSLLLNSRRSTMKSNRSALVPLQEHSTPVARNRAISVNVAVPEKNDSFDENDEHEHEHEASEESLNGCKKDEGDGSAHRVTYKSLDPPKQRHVLTALAVSRMRQLSMNLNTDQISDYAAFILSDESDNDDKTLQTSDEPGISEPLQKPPKTTFREPSTASEQGLDSVLECYQAQDPLPESRDLNRNSSSASNSSYNSLQSEKHFNVGPSLRRVAAPASRMNSVGSKKKSRVLLKKYLPPIAGPPPPITPLAQPQNVQDFETQRQLSFIKRQSTGSLPMSDMYLQQIQQQIQQLQQLQQMQQMQQMHHMHSQYNLQASPGGPPRSSDAFINAKIEEFVQLRTVIAAGNKTFEYRLKWLKMLISATNNKLFAYINIKGETIPQDHVQENKQFFIRLSVNHLQKLLKELGRSERKESQRLYAEACFIQGCLFLNAYLARFGQDFGYQFDMEAAELQFNLCLENNPGYFRAYYELGELYEAQQEEEAFDVALENYTESAKMGYNRAIYKIALINLLVPKMRLPRFFSYFKKLADIDMESNDVQLSGADRDELEEIVGLAQFQLGKIYEGIYPGDLTAEDEFVQESLEIAPVNYLKSLSYYNKAAKLSCVQAQVRLGRVYEDGELGRDQNPKKSVQWFMRASSSPLKYKRHPEAMLGLSRWLIKGTNGASKHVPCADPEMAVQWCERACKEFAYPEAYYQMGILVEQGFAAGDPHVWFEQAWQAGHMAAGERMGVSEQDQFGQLSEEV